MDVTITFTLRRSSASSKRNAPNGHDCGGGDKQASSVSNPMVRPDVAVNAPRSGVGQPGRRCVPALPE